jgi:YVTN family beta-propeller protein
VIDGATNETTTVAAGTHAVAVAVNPVTNRVYVANNSTDSVTVIDGATNAATTVAVGSQPYAIAVNPVTNKVYVSNENGVSVTVIDGATNATTTLATGVSPVGVAVNPATNKIYVCSYDDDNVMVITDAPVNDTKVRAAFDRLPGDTTVFARPPLTGKGVNRWTPGRTTMMGVGNRLSTAQKAWDWANVTSGAGTDSITWTYTWGTDSLIMGENFVCCVPLEDQAGITNNLGLGTPFAGNLEVYPVYRMAVSTGVADKSRESSVGTPTLTVFPNPCPGKARITYSLPKPGNISLKLYDVSGRVIATLVNGARKAGRYSMTWNRTDTRGDRVAAGVYVCRFTCGDRTVAQKLVVE